MISSDRARTSTASFKTVRFREGTGVGRRDYATSSSGSCLHPYASGAGSQGRSPVAELYEYPDSSGNGRQPWLVTDIIRLVRQEDVWDAESAERYDTPGIGMFSPEVLGPTVDRLAALAGSGRVLEFAIGTGRVAVPLAQRGVTVTGIELSRPMIEQLRTKVDEATVPVVVGDMATARAPGEYTLVYLVYNTISNLLSQAEQVACFRNASRHLTPGGRFVIELWVPELRTLPPVQQATVSQSEPGYIGLDTYDVLHQRIVSHHFTFGSGKEARVFRSPHRYIWPAELDLMGQLAGFKLETRHADWAGTEFDSGSRSHVSVYRLASWVAPVGRKGIDPRQRPRLDTIHDARV
ncbi:MAG: putative methyltransferase [Acidimicrobiaceae bacterium]|nr:putative methyltransferase [Acidimicrobiaceae bacterium]